MDWLGWKPSACTLPTDAINSSASLSNASYWLVDCAAEELFAAAVVAAYDFPFCEAGTTVACAGATREVMLALNARTYALRRLGVRLFNSSGLLTWAAVKVVFGEVVVELSTVAGIGAPGNTGDWVLGGGRKLTPSSGLVEDIVGRGWI